MSVLIVVATAPEAEAFAGLGRVVVSGVGPVAAALATWRAIAGQALRAPYTLVVSAGIGGAYPSSGLGVGDVAVSSHIIQADLGAWNGEEFLDLSALGLSIFPNRPQAPTFAAWEGAQALAERTGAAYGPLLTLSSVTGDAATAAALSRRYSGALTEGMEGAGVAHAAALSGLPVLEVRGVSNTVGPRERESWRMSEALQAARSVVSAL